MEFGLAGCYAMKPEVQAAWVQAIGSIAAILIAIAIPAAQHFITMRGTRRERADRARSLGLLLLPHIKSFAAKNEKIWSEEHQMTMWKI